MLFSDHEQGGYFPPVDIDNFLDAASMWLFNEFSALYAKDIEAYEALSPFKMKLGYTTAVDGKLTVSSLGGYKEYVQLLSLSASKVDAVTGGTRVWNVEILKEDEIAARLNSQVNAPSGNYPIAEEIEKGVFYIYPSQAHAGEVRYLRRPVKPVFGYTQAGRVITYNAGTSTQIDWSEKFHNKILFKALELAGINLDNSMLIQSGAQVVAQNV